MSMDWISVKDRLPEREQHDYVLVCCTMNVTSTINYENAVTMAYVCEEGFMDVELNEVITRGVTHWMPLPEPPAGTAEGGQPVTAKRLSAMLVLALAAIALTVCAGLAAGVSMWPWVVGYWAVLTAKNIVDYIGTKARKRK
jgi:hypothetical protein